MSWQEQGQVGLKGRVRSGMKGKRQVRNHQSLEVSGVAAARLSK